MDCRAAQERLYLAPFTDAIDVRAHTAQCKMCWRVAAELMRLECAIRDAALDTRVPEGLAARVLLRKQLSTSE